MSLEVINTFTSAKNIKYLEDILSKKIKDNIVKSVILDTLTETIFNFQTYNSNYQYLRHSVNVEDEIQNLNTEFINDRLAFAENFDKYATGEEYYADQMFIEDSLRPGPYSKFNDNTLVPSLQYNKRLFRYQDKNNLNRSSIPIWQVINRGNIDYNNADELRDSEISQSRKSIESSSTDYLNTIQTECNRPKWTDI